MGAGWKSFMSLQFLKQKSGLRPGVFFVKE